MRLNTKVEKKGSNLQKLRMAICEFLWQVGQAMSARC